MNTPVSSFGSPSRGAGRRPPVFLWMGRRPLLPFTALLAAELERKRAIVASLPRFGVRR